MLIKCCGQNVISYTPQSVRRTSVARSAGLNLYSEVPGIH